MKLNKQYKVKFILQPLAESLMSAEFLSKDTAEAEQWVDKSWYEFLERALELEFTDEGASSEVRNRIASVLQYLNSKQK